MHVGLLACDEVAQRFRHIAGGYQQMFEQLLSPHIPGLRVTRFDVQALNLPADARTCDGWITTGSRASVYDDVAWIGAVETFVRKVADSDRPLVGICFGHQLLARMLGAEVKRAPRGWGVGVLPMSVVRREDWMTPPRSTVRLQYMHARSGHETACRSDAAKRGAALSRGDVPVWTAPPADRGTS